VHTNFISFDCWYFHRLITLESNKNNNKKENASHIFKRDLNNTRETGTKNDCVNKNIKYLTVCKQNAKRDD